jgi:membrane protease subunit (stomatin/prohibitin family)
MLQLNAYVASLSVPEQSATLVMENIFTAMRGDVLHYAIDHILGY